jgi:histidine triad (HIT) family protein
VGRARRDVGKIKMTIVEQIVKREIPAVIIRENEDVIAFMDHEPINRGHVLVCTKKPYESFIDVPEEIMNKVLDVARDIYRSLLRKYSPDGISMIQCNGKFNDLKHFHLHIFPRNTGDGFGWNYRNPGIQTQEDLQVDAQGL